MSDARGSAFPEFLNRADMDNGTWEVQSSASPRTSIHDRTMRVPLGRDPHSRATRARELMRAKVSMDNLVVPDDYDANVEIVSACEEVRLNSLLKHAKVNPDDIDTRHIPFIVDRAVASDDANTIVDAIVRAHGTKASSVVARAIRTAAAKHNKPGANEFAKALRKVVRSNTNGWDGPWYRTSLADTDPYTVNVGGAPTTVTWGYRNTLSLASEVSRFLQHAGRRTGWGPVDPDTSLPGGMPEASDMPDGFAPLHLDKLHLTERVAGRMGRKRSATNVGINPRRIHRYLVDPEKRIFDKRIKGIGGVVLIDQSGSMHLSTDDVWEIIKSSPGATIIGYSHGHRGIPNCWVLAENGKVVADVRDGNGGNGVDGPALLYAISKRKKGEPLIWVCDGYVTGDGDSHTYDLAAWCAKVVANHKVHMVEDVPEAVAALKQVRDGRVLPVRATGPVLNAMHRIAAKQASAA